MHALSAYLVIAFAFVLICLALLPAAHFARERLRGQLCDLERIDGQAPARVNGSGRGSAGACLHAISKPEMKQDSSMNDAQRGDPAAPHAARAKRAPGHKDLPERAAEPTTWHPDRVYVDCDLVHVRLGRLLDAGDDAGIWECHQAARDRSACEDWLSRLCGTATRRSTNPRDRSRVTTWNSCLVASGFVLPDGSGAQRDTQSDSWLAQAVWSEWRDWVPAQQQVRVMAQTLPYAAVCGWSPVVQRQSLAQLTRQPYATGAPRVAGAIACLPPDFPQLYFVVGSVERWLAYPELADPIAASRSEWPLLQRLAGHIGYRFARQVEPAAVRAPAFFADALLEGVRLWIGEVARRGLVAGWQLEPGGRDTVLIELKPVSSEAGKVVLPLRGHQLGSAGMELVLMDLQHAFGAPRAGASRLS